MVSKFFTDRPRFAMVISVVLSPSATGMALLHKAESLIGNSVGRSPTLRGQSIVKPCKGDINPKFFER